MKPQLQFIRPALGGPQATTAEARMVKVQQNRLYAYGGAFCLSTPLASPLECGFFPKLVEAFYALPREGATFTEKDGWLIMRHGETEERTRTFPVTQIPSLQAVGKRFEVKRQLSNLSTVATLCRNNAPDFTQAAWFIDGQIFAMKGRTLVFATDGFEFEHPPFALPCDSMQALARISSLRKEEPLVGVVYDRQALQFEFADGSMLASTLLEGFSPPQFLTMFEGFDDPDRFRELKFTENSMNEVEAIKLKSEEDESVTLDMQWKGEKGNLSFEIFNKDGTLADSGILTNAYTGEGDFCIRGESLRTIFSLKPELVGLLRRNTDAPAHALNGYGTNFSVGGCLTRLPS